MDPLAHTLTGITLANSGIRQRIGAGTVLALILASNIVDVDIFGSLLLSEPSWRYRRMWTHSIFTAPVLIIGGTLVFRLLFRQASIWQWLSVFSIGVLMHVFMDLINSYGVVLFFPVSRERIELAWVFIIDIYIWGILLCSLLLPRAAKLFRCSISIEQVSKAALVLLLFYIAGCGALRALSLSILHQHGAAQLSNYSFSYVFPEPFGPWRFHGVLREGDIYSSYLITPLSGTVEKKRSYKTDEQDPEIAHLVDSKSGKHYKWFFKAPVWQKVNKNEAIVSDIRFKSLLIGRSAPFVYRLRGKNPRPPTVHPTPG